jgi:hypothetical protein
MLVSAIRNKLLIAKLYEIKTLMTLFNLYAKPKTVGKLKRKKRF